MEGRLVSEDIEVGNRVYSIYFSPDGNKFACGADEDICVYDVERGVLIFDPLRGREHHISSVLWSHDGR